MSTLALKSSLLPTWASDLFDTGNLLGRNLLDFNGGYMGWNPAMRIPTVNIRETEKDFQMEMAAPGKEKKDFRISFENGILTIGCEKKEERNEQKENFMRREFSYDSFSRSFTLPENCLPEKIDAKYENGLLKITLPKKEVTLMKTAKEIKVT